MPRRKREKPPEPPTTELIPTRPPRDETQPDDRSWSSRRNVPERAARTDLVPYMALPAETGPTFAPDQLSIWPVEGGRFGIDARYHGSSGAARAAQQKARLGRGNVSATVRGDDGGGAILRLGPLAPSAAWVAIEAFLGRPLDADPPV